MWFPWRRSTVEEQRAGRWLRWRIVGALLLVSAVPFVVVGTGAWVVFRNLAIERTLAQQRTIARGHAAAIDMFLAEKIRTLEMTASTNTMDQLVARGVLREVFASITSVHADGFVDLGVIDGQGRHRAYVGPYDLLDRTYGEADWFQAVLAQGTIVSDVFLGFRQVPHSVIAVRRPSPEGWWILRATIDSRSLIDLVRSLEVGTAGDVFIVNRDGIYQTPPRSGAVLAASTIVDPLRHTGIRDERIREDGLAVRRVTTWLNSDRWLLVVQQPEREILAPVHRAVVVGGLIAAAALALVVLATLLVTTHLTRQVEYANQQRDLMYVDVLRSAKLASLGELATGLAHEINTPLATISAEQTNLEDGVAALDLAPETRQALQKSIDRCKRQVTRCGNITAKMLQFGRKTDTVLTSTVMEPVLREIVALLERRARTHNVTLRLEIARDLPAAWLDANELEQVLANLVTNAVDAMPRGGTVTIEAMRDGDAVLLNVRDDGCGISPDDLDRVFQPFFTTKPVGQGTGLGLSVVYGIVRGWGGRIHVESTVGRGTTVAVHIPVSRRPNTEGEER